MSGHMLRLRMSILGSLVLIEKLVKVISFNPNPYPHLETEESSLIGRVCDVSLSDLNTKSEQQSWK